jgi:Rieske Fe-S protein
MSGTGLPGARRGPDEDVAASGGPDAAAPPEPVWRRDFPYAAADEDDVTRREFVRFLLLGSGAFAAGTVAVAAITSAQGDDDGGEQRVASVDDVRPDRPVLFRYPTGDDPAILLARPDGELLAYSQKCTHLGCVVYLDGSGERLVCPCHEGGFSAGTGDVVFGPPERPLPRIAVEVRDGEVWATGIDRG